MKKLLVLILLGAGLLLLIILVEYQKATFIPQWYYKESNIEKNTIVKKDLSGLYSNKTTLSKKDVESILNAAMILYLNDIGLSSEIIKKLKVKIEKDNIKIGIVINFRELDLSKIPVENIPITLKILRILNPQNIYAAIEGNNRIVNGRLKLDENSMFLLGKNHYKLINLLQISETSDIFLTGLVLPEIFCDIKSCEYSKGFTNFVLNQ